MDTLAHPPYSPVPARIEGWLRSMDATGDRRGLFLRTYGLNTCTLIATLESGAVHDPEWSLSLLELLADFYFATLESVHPFPTVCPPAWEVAHRLAADGAVGDGDALLLSLSAQLNNDLPQALATVLDREWPLPGARLGRRHGDFRTMLDVVAETTECSSASWVFSRILRSWGASAWETALMLVTAGDTRWRSAICEDLEHAALKRAHVIACVTGLREHLVAMPSEDLHRAFDRHRAAVCRCNIAAAGVDSWAAVSV